MHFRIYSVLAVFFLVSVSSFAQNIIVDGTNVLASSQSKFPIWLKAGQTLAAGTNISSVSVIEYNVVSSPSGGNVLTLEQVVKVTTMQTVPAGKAWKIESVLMDPSVSSLTTGWTDDGTVVRLTTNTDNVGIGNSTPTQRLDITGKLGLSAKEALDGGDSWLRLNQSAQFTSGTYTPGFLRADAGIASGPIGSLGAGTINTSDIINSAVGYRIANAAATGNYLRGNGTNFVSSAILAADIPTGSGNYIQNSTSPQASSNFNISGTGQAGISNIATIGNHPSYTTSYAAFWRNGSDYSILADANNTFLNAPASSGNLYFRAANADKMILLGSSGNVGIGSLSPTVKLKVSADIESGGMLRGTGWLTGTGTGPGIELGYTGGYSYLHGYDRTAGTYTPARLVGSTIDLRHSDASSDIYVTTTGNVGIGTNAPQSTLSVANEDMINLYRPSNNTLSIQTTLDNQPLGTYGGTENRLCLQPLVGQVGIGTTNPTSKLDVIGGDVNVAGQGRFKAWYTQGSGLAAEIGISSGQAYLLSYDRTASAYQPMNLSGSTVGIGHSGTTDLFIPASGNVGINNTSPAEKLQVGGKIKADQLDITTGAVISIYLSVCNGGSTGACSGNGPGSTAPWTNVSAAGYTWAVAQNTATNVFSHNGSGTVTVAQAGTYMIRFQKMATPAGDLGWTIGVIPYINGVADGHPNGNFAYHHGYCKAGYWDQNVSTYVRNLPAGTTVGYGYYIGGTLTYWAHCGYTAMEIIRIN